MLKSTDKIPRNSKLVWSIANGTTRLPVTYVKRLGKERPGFVYVKLSNGEVTLAELVDLSFAQSVTLH